jgi:hypothetical protein
MPFDLSAPRNPESTPSRARSAGAAPAGSDEETYVRRYLHDVVHAPVRVTGGGPDFDAASLSVRIRRREELSDPVVPSTADVEEFTGTIRRVKSRGRAGFRTRVRG